MTQIVTFKGKALYAQPWENQIDREYEDPDSGRGGNWSIKLIVDDENLRLFNALGAKAKTKRVDELKKTDGLEEVINNKYLTLRRYEYANYGKGWEALGPVKVTGVAEGTAIGNLSDLTVAVEAYPFTFKGKPGIGLRLVSVHVDNLVEYKKPEAATADDNTPPVH